MALISSTLANVAISALGKKGAKMTSVLDFLPKWDSEMKEENSKSSSDDGEIHEAQSVEDQKKVLETIARLCGGRRKKDGRN